MFVPLIRGSSVEQLLGNVRSSLRICEGARERYEDPANNMNSTDLRPPSSSVIPISPTATAFSDSPTKTLPDFILGSLSSNA